MTKLEQRYSGRVRKAFTGAGCEVTQVMEAGCPGPSDLVIEWPFVFCWLELKVDSKVRAEQGHFLRRHWSNYGNAFLLKYDLEDDMHKLWRGHEPLLVGHELWVDKVLDVEEMKLAMSHARNGQLHRLQDQIYLYQ
jgi:hypothetical protein